MVSEFIVISQEHLLCEKIKDVIKDTPPIFKLYRFPDLKKIRVFNLFN